MNNSDYDEDDIVEIYKCIQGMSSSLITKMQVDPLMVAAVLASTALSLYKTTLPEDDFNDIGDALANSRDSVRPFLPYPEAKETLH